MSQIHNILNCFKSKRVLVTGHTGFKGSWLSSILNELGAQVFGISLELSENNKHYLELNLESKIPNLLNDVTDLVGVQSVINKIKPHFIFHLAAQSLVRLSYENPVNTWNTNVMGTQSILEGLRTLDHSCVAVLVTSDKCYENNEWIWGYRENDRLGGSDPYSSSKAAAEVLISSYYRSYFSDLNSKIRLASVRAGNVVGGGDWAKDRIVPDCMQNWSDGKTSVLRSPLATRPWQHVLEPLVGYLGLASSLIENRQTSGEAYNFGPDANQVHTVWDLVGALSTRINGRFPSIKYIAEKSSTSDKEAGLLKLNCDKAYSELGWSPILKFNDTINYTADWYEAYYNKNKILTNDQIIDYLSIFKNHKVR